MKGGVLEKSLYVILTSSSSLALEPAVVLRRTDSLMLDLANVSIVRRRY